MSVGAQMVVVLKAFVEHCVSLVLGHPFECSWLDVSQTDVFHPFLLVSGDSESHSSSFCYQIVVRETENRQLLYFLASSGALKLSKGRAAALPTQLLFDLLKRQFVCARRTRPYPHIN